MKLFVWDLHGTLEKGNEDAALEITNKILEKFGYSERLTQELGTQLYGNKWHEYFHYLLPKESSETHLILQEACFELSNTEEGVKIISSYISPSSYAFEVLQAIQAQHEQIVISNTTPKSLPIFLTTVGIADFFKNGRAIAVNKHAKENLQTKSNALRTYMQNKMFDEIVLIGDSPSDIDLAREFNGKGYLYAHPGKPFKDKHADYYINDLREVLKEI